MSGESQEPRAAQVEGPGAALQELVLAFPFGPTFFLGQLGAFARQRCPDPDEGLPVVELHLADGEVLDLCHVMGVAPTWVALAVLETERSSATPRMRTELVPYASIARVTVRASRLETPHIGFDQSQVPRVLPGTTRPEKTPEDVLQAAASADPTPQRQRRNER